MEISNKYLITFSITKPKNLLEDYNKMVSAIEGLGGQCIRFHKSAFFVVTSKTRDDILDILEVAVKNSRVLVIDISLSNWSTYYPGETKEERELISWMKKNI